MEKFVVTIYRKIPISGIAVQPRYSFVITGEQAMNKFCDKVVASDNWDVDDYCSVTSVKDFPDNL